MSFQVLLDVMGGECGMIREDEYGLVCGINQFRSIIYLNYTSVPLDLFGSTL